MNATVDGSGLSVIIMVDGEVVFAVTVDAVDDETPATMDVIVHPDVDPDNFRRALALAADQVKHVEMMRRTRGLVDAQIKKQQFDNAAAFDPDIQ